jgi:DNA repair protein RecO (recombination protein O)
MIQKTEAIVLRRREFRETSLILTLYTKDFGKIAGLAKGVRIARTRWSSSFPLLSHNTIVFYEKKGLHLITEADLLNSFKDNYADLYRNAVANYLIELTDLVTPWEEKNTELFEMILQALALLNQEKDIKRLEHIFELRLLRLSGFMPHIDGCVSCQKKIEKLARFSHRMGGLLCPDCFGQDKAARAINHGTISTLSHILGTDDECRLARLKMSSLIREHLGFILREFLSYHLERLPRSYVSIEKAVVRN